MTWPEAFAMFSGCLLLIVIVLAMCTTFFDKDRDDSLISRFIEDQRLSIQLFENFNERLELMKEYIDTAVYGRKKDDTSQSRQDTGSL